MRAMFSYFREWKRKAGFVVLMFACTLSSGWVRCLYLGDVFCVKVREQLYSIHSVNNSLTCVKEKLIHNIMGRVPNPLDPNGGSVPRMIRIELAPPPSWQDYRSYESSRKMLAPYQIDDPTLIRLPYWSIVIPLTGVSAWLLLSKRRQPTKPESSQESEA